MSSYIIHANAIQITNYKYIELIILIQFKNPFSDNIILKHYIVVKLFDLLQTIMTSSLLIKKKYRILVYISWCLPGQTLRHDQQEVSGGITGRCAERRARQPV